MGSTQISTGQTILLVEDDASVRATIKSTLELLDYHCDCVESAADALAYLETNKDNVDLLISDIILTQGMNGFELGDMVLMHYPMIKVAYISGHAQDAIAKQESGKAGVDILQKPFKLEALARYVQIHMRKVKDH